jgi:integrase
LSGSTLTESGRSSIFRTPIISLSRGSKYLDSTPIVESVVRDALAGEQNAVFCSRLLFRVNGSRSQNFSSAAWMPFMSGSLFDKDGVRKYLTARERFAFARAAYREGGEVGTFCLMLAYTGPRVSEALALPRERIDVSNNAVVFRTLKQRGAVIYRAIPVPPKFIMMLRRVHHLDAVNYDPKERLWKWGRTTAWKRVKSVMKAASISERLAMPKSARHAFGVEAGQKGIPLNIVQRWLGHARIETTAIYASAIGDEERNLARKAWRSLETVIPPG